MARREESEEDAKIAADGFNAAFGSTEKRPVGLVLGTGWGDALQISDAHECALKTTVPAFARLEKLVGHARTIVCGKVNGMPIVALRGRVHLNESCVDPDIFRLTRLQIEILIHLGVETLILTAAVGSLKPRIKVGSIVAVDGFVTVYAPPMPLFAGEFCSPEDTLDPKLRKIARKAAHKSCLPFVEAGHAMVRGPFFEGRKYDKPLLAASGAGVVGMSILPEACVAALYPGVRVLALGFVTNTASEEHSHETNQARAKKSSAKLGVFLHRLLRRVATSV